MPRREPPEICPNCGALVPRTARACPECGADEQTGWSDRATAQRLGLPDEEFDYEEFIREEFGQPEGRRLRPCGIRPLWWAVAVLLLVLFVAWLLRLL